MHSDYIRGSGEIQSLKLESKSHETKNRFGIIIGRIVTTLKYVAKNILISIDKVLTFVCGVWLFSLESLAEKIDTIDDSKHSNFNRHLSRFSILVIKIIAYPPIKYLETTEKWKD